MREYDKIPRTSHDDHFPMADVSDVRKLNVADKWLKDMALHDHYEFSTYIHAKYKATDKDSINARFNDQGAVVLTQYWGREIAENPMLVTRGYELGSIFIRDTNFLPDFDMDLRQPLMKMRLEDADPIFFAQNAWAGMARSHPNVFAKYERLYELGAEHFDIDNDTNETLFIAGLALSYMLSVTAWLEKDVKISKFTSMVNLRETKHDFKAMQFGKLFSTAPGLASNIPSKRFDN